MVRPARNHPVDRHVGAAIRTRRRALGMSQSELGRHLGLTFQQIQKYEQGTNRVAASALYEIAEALSTPVGALFDGLPGVLISNGESKERFARFLKAEESATIIELFPDLEEDGCGSAIATLIREIVAARSTKRRSV